MAGSWGLRVLLASLAFVSTSLAWGQEKHRPHLDIYGDPLPARALARIGSTRLRHDHTVQSLAFSADGKLLASCGNDYTVRLWELATGRELRQFGHSPARASAEAPARMVHAVALSPNGKLLAAGFGDDAVFLWDAATGKELHKLSGHTGAVRAVVFSPDGNFLASGSIDQGIRVWDPATGKLIHQVTAQEPVSCLAFSPDSQTLVCGTSYGSIRVFQAAKGTELRVIEGHKGAINTVTFSSDGQTVASAGADKVIRLWNVSPAMNPQFSPFLWSAIPWGRRPGFVPIIQGIEYLRLSREVRELSGHQADVECAVFMPGGKILISAGLDRMVRFWDPLTGKELRQLEGQLGPIYSLALSRDGKTLATGDENCTIRLWNVDSGKEISPPGGHQGPVEYIAYSADGRTLTTSSRDLTIRIWEAATGKMLRQFAGLSRKGTSVAHSSDGKLAASGAPDGMIHLWEPATGQEIRRFGRHQGAVLALAFAPDGKTLASGGEDQTVRFWNPATGEELDQLKGPEKAIAFVVFSPDGKTLAAGTGDETVFTWDVATGKEIHQLSESGAETDCVAFSPDNKLLALGSRDGIVRLWEVATGQMIRQFEAQPGVVLAVAFAADGKTVAAGSWLTVRLWETFSGRERGRLDGQQGDVRSLAFSPDGKTLAAGTGGSTVLIWDITGRLEEGRLEVANLAPRDLEPLWTDLYSEDAARAYRAVWTLVAGAKQSVAFLQSRLKPVPILDAQEQRRLAELIASLDSEDFNTRERANAELERLAETAEPALRKALAAQPGAETRRRLEAALEKLQAPGKLRERLRLFRASEVLEKIGSPEAQQVLKAISQGAPEFVITQDAKSTLERLARRPVPRP
jgi:WD40 repeat protein